VAADGLIKLWNLTNYECISSMGEGQALLKVQWLLANQVVTTSVDGIIRIWDIRKMTAVAFDKH
jgi:WD40 repeat protein